MIIEEAANFIQEKFKNRLYSLRHTLRVVDFVQKIAPKESIDLEEIKIAALFHDIGRVHKARDTKHSEISARITEDWLTKKAYPKGKMRRIVSAIRVHTLPTEKAEEKISELLAQVLWDADHLDKLGIVGFLRVIYTMGRDNDQDSFEKAATWFVENSKKITQNLFTKTAREIANEKNRKTKEFVHLFETEINL